MANKHLKPKMGLLKMTIIILVHFSQSFVAREPFQCVYKTNKTLFRLFTPEQHFTVMMSEVIPPCPCLLILLLVFVGLPLQFIFRL